MELFEGDTGVRGQNWIWRFYKVVLVERATPYKYRIQTITIFASGDIIALIRYGQSRVWVLRLANSFWTITSVI